MTVLTRAGFVFLLCGALFPARSQIVDKPDFAKIRKMIADHLAANAVPSMAVAVARNGKILWEVDIAQAWWHG